MTKMKTAVHLIWVILLSFQFINCSDDTIIYGQYNTEPGFKLKNYKIRFSLAETIDTKKQYHYYANLSKDGKFKIRVKEKGIYFAFITLNKYPQRDFLLSDRPYLSSELKNIYTVDTTKKSILIDEYLYLSKPLSMYSPSKNEKLSQHDEKVMAWQEDYFADYYHVSLVSHNEEPEKLVSLNAFITGNSIVFKELFNLPVVTESGNHLDDFEPFARLRGEIISGKYYFDVNGVKIVKGENRHIYTSEYKNVEIELNVDK